MHPRSSPLLVALALLLATPAAADISFVSSNAFVEAFTATDGIDDRPPQIDASDFATFDETSEADTEGARATARQTTRVTQTAESVSVTSSGGTDISHCCTADDRPRTGAGANAAFSITVCVDERSSFTASGNASVQSNGDESSTADLTICCNAEGDNAVEEEAEDAPGRPRSVSGSHTGILDPDSENGNSCVSLSVGNNSSLGSGQPSSTTTWTASLSVVSSPAAPEQSEAFLWVAGSAGAFGDPESWDPTGAADSGVPTLVDGVRQDAGVVAIPGPVTMDLAGALAAARGPRGPVQRRIGRLAVSRTSSLRPVGGTLLLDNLDLDIQGVGATVDGRSLEVGRGATLNLDQGIVQARHVAIGSEGDGTLTVQGPEGAFSTLGRFGIGADGDGNVDITNGATVTSAETVLGELSGQGSARIDGQGSLWQTGNLAVGLEDDAALSVEGGARVESGEAFVDFGLSGDERARVVVRGEDAAQNASTWAVAGFLDVGAGGKIDVREGGALEASVVRIGTGGNEADCLLGQACLDVEDGTLTADGIAIGLEAAAGKLRVGPNGRISNGLALGLLTGTGFDSRGEIEVVGPSAEDQIASAGGIQLGNDFAGHGELRLSSGAKASSSSDVSVGTVAGGFGLLELEGEAADPEATRFRAEGVETQLRVGAESAEPAESLVTPTGEVAIQNGVVELVDADLEIGRLGRVAGLGRIDGGGVSFVSNDGVIGCGIEIDAIYLQGEQGTLECPQAVLPGLPLLDPLTASALGRRVRARLVPPPPPPAGPFVVTGDATLAGQLVLRFLNGFAPSAGDGFPLLDVGGTLTGDFSNVVVQGLAPGSFDFAPSVQDGLLTLTSTTDAVALPAVSLTGKTKLKEKKKAGLKLSVSREGDTSAALPVAYRVGGTATNGVDYELLTGVVEIPARKKSAKLVLKPRRDGSVESLETIEIELLPGEGYSIGLFSSVTVELASADGLKAPKSPRR